jgi:hypothetical protein
MRQGKHGFHIHCKCCAREFESLGLRYCDTCMALPARERRDQPEAAGGMCQRPGCDQRIPKWRGTGKNRKRVRSNATQLLASPAAARARRERPRRRASERG